MAGPSRAQVREQLIGLFPPGTEDVIDWRGEPGELLDAVAGTVKAGATDRVEKARLETSPLTVQDLLPIWEGSLLLSGTATSLSGTVQQRRNQLVGRLRGKGAPTLRKVRSVAGLALDYADPGLLVVLEVDRAALRAAHTRVWTGSLPFTMIAATVSWSVLDRAKVSKGGAQVDVTINHPDLTQVSGTLTAPDGRQRTVSPIGRGSGVGTFRMFFAGMAGAQVAGTWTLAIGAVTGAGTITQADLFVEGVGRDAAGLDGLGAVKGYWGVLADPALMGPSANLDDTNAAIRFINYATRNGRIVRKTVVMGAAACVVPDEAAAIPDECVPC